MIFDVITLFPGIFESPLNESIIKRAIDKGIIEVRLHNLRDFTHDKHRVVDDTPYGGGSGMVMKVEPIVEAIESLRKEESTVILLSPQGKPFVQPVAKSLSLRRHLILICGRYEGIDERVATYVDEVISLGDFVMTGGEVAALAIIDSVARLIPNVLGSHDSTEEESFSWDILEYPHYTRPAEFRGENVPAHLLSGNHEKIRQWRRKEALRKTLETRPDIIEKLELSDEDKGYMEEIHKERSQSFAHLKVKSDD